MGLRGGVAGGLLLAAGTLAQQPALRSSVDFGGSCAGGPDELWTGAAFGPRGSRALQLSASSAVFLQSVNGSLAAGPEFLDSWRAAGAAGTLASATSGLCVSPGTGSLSACSGEAQALTGAAAWTSNATYVAVTGLPGPAAPSTVVSGEEIRGEWTQATLVAPSTVTSYAIQPPLAPGRRWPRAHVLAGSADGGATWFALGRHSSGPGARAYGTPSAANFSCLGSANRPQLVRLIVTAVAPAGDGRAQIGGLSFAATPQRLWFGPPTGLSSATESATLATADAWAAPVAQTRAVASLGGASTYAEAKALFEGSSDNGTSAPLGPDGALPAVTQASVHSVSFVAARSSPVAFESAEAAFLLDLTDGTTGASRLQAGHVYRALILVSSGAAKLSRDNGAIYAGTLRAVTPPAASAAAPVEPPPQAARSPPCGSPHFYLLSDS